MPLNSVLKESISANWNRRVTDPAQLTVAQLKEINRDLKNRRWVWIDVLADGEYGKFANGSAYYMPMPDVSGVDAFNAGYPGTRFLFRYEDYGKTWIAYDRRPERGE